MSINLMNFFSKQVFYYGTGTMFSLGFFRGCEQYNYRHIKCKNKSATLEDYMISTVFGVINGSLYINPTLACFALYDEYYKMKLSLSKKYDDTLYYSNSFGLE